MSRRGKIVCTLGPATQSDELILALVEAGMDVARLNFSHGDYADHKAAYERLSWDKLAPQYAKMILRSAGWPADQSTSESEPPCL